MSKTIKDLTEFLGWEDFCYIGLPHVDSQFLCGKRKLPDSVRHSRFLDDSPHGTAGGAPLFSGPLAQAKED